MKNVLVHTAAGNFSAQSGDQLFEMNIKANLGNVKRH